MRLPVPPFPADRTPLAPPRRRLGVFSAYRREGRPAPYSTRVALSGQRHAHLTPSPAGPPLGRAVGHAEYLGYLDVGEIPYVPQDHRCAVFLPHVAQGHPYLLPTLRAERRRLGVAVPPGRLRDGRRLPVRLALPPARFLLAEAQAGVHSNAVQPGTEGALPPEASDAGPRPNPHLLARVPGILPTEDATGHPVDAVRMLPDQLPEGLDVAPGCAKGQQSIPAARPGSCTGRFARAGRRRA